MGRRCTVALLAALVLAGGGCSDGDPPARTTSTTVEPTDGAAERSGATTYDVPLSGAGLGPEPGDPDLTGTATLTVSEQGEACIEVDLGDRPVPVTTVHLVDGPIDRNGGIIAQMYPGTPGPSSPPATSRPADPDVGTRTPPIEGCGQIQIESLVEVVADEPGRFNVTIRTREFPGGIVKGALPDA